MIGDALDFSFQPPDLDECVRVGVRRLLGYTGTARVSQDYYDRAVELGIEFTFVQETTSTRSQEGWGAGVLDAQFADGRCDQRNYPLDKPVCYVVSDGNRGDPNWNGEAIADYGQAIAATSRRPFFFYGNRYAVDAANAGAARAGAKATNVGAATDGGWVPRTWNADEGRDLLIQEPNLSTPIDGTDYNTVHHDYTTGVAPAPPTPEDDDDMLKLLQGDTSIVGNAGLHTVILAQDEVDAYRAVGVPLERIPEANMQGLLATSRRLEDEGKPDPVDVAALAAATAKLVIASMPTGGDGQPAPLDPALREAIVTAAGAAQQAAQAASASADALAAVLAAIPAA